MATTAEPAPPRPSVGRPRRFEEETEVRLILKATNAVMRRNAYAEATVQDILDEAGLSTGAFYRHFQSKDDLLRALYRRDAEAAAERLEARVEAATTSRARLEEWIDEVLSFGYDPRRARQTAMVHAEVTRKMSGRRDEEQASEDRLTRSLLATLKAGKKDGSFPRSQPERDAATIYALTFVVMKWLLFGQIKVTRRVALDHVLRFTLPALGAE